MKKYSGAKKYLGTTDLCWLSDLKRWARSIIFIIGTLQLREKECEKKNIYEIKLYAFFKRIYLYNDAENKYLVKNKS